MRDVEQEIVGKGARLVAIGSGRAEHAQDFRQEQGIGFPLLVDPELEAYAAAGLRRGVGSVLKWQTVGNTLRAWRGGHRQTKVQGDPWQQGGAFVIAPPDRVLLEHVSTAPGDHVDPARLLEALP